MLQENRNCALPDRKKPLKKQPFRSGQKKNLWKCIHHLMQQLMTPRKGHNFISLDVIQYTNAKEKEKTSKEDD